MMTVVALPGTVCPVIVVAPRMGLLPATERAETSNRLFKPIALVNSVGVDTVSRTSTCPS